MHNDLEIKEPEIMPPAPQKEPERIVLKFLQIKIRQKRISNARGELMFRPRSTDFDTRASNIAGHLRAIERNSEELEKVPANAPPPAHLRRATTSPT